VGNKRSYEVWFLVLRFGGLAGEDLVRSGVVGSASERSPDLLRSYSTVRATPGRHSEDLSRWGSKVYKQDYLSYKGCLPKQVGIQRE
jgi:hypothetical protein